MGHGANSNPFNRARAARGGVNVAGSQDRFGHDLQSGDVVYLINKQDIMWQVVHVKPVLDASAPPGLVELALQAIFVPRVPGGQRVMDVIKVRDASEFAPMPADDLPPAAPPNDEADA